MAAEKGLSFLLKSEDTIGGGVFTNLAGQRTTSFTLNGESVDVTTKDSAGQWRELLGGAGTVSMDISGDGVFQDNSNLTQLHTDLVAREVERKYQIIFESGDIFEGKFQPTTFDKSGVFNGEDTFTLTLLSNGEITFTAA